MDRKPWDVISKAHDVGLRQHMVLKEYGGYAAKLLTMHTFSEAGGYYGGDFGKMFTQTWKHCQSLAFAPKSVQDEVFPVFMKNRKTYLAASLTEPDHGSDWLTTHLDETTKIGKVFAYKDKDEWVINGEKMYCSGGGVSDYIIVHVRTEKDVSFYKGITSFLCKTDLPGLTIRVNDMMANDLSTNTQTIFENYRIPDRLRISPVNGAFEYMHARLANKTIYIPMFLGQAQWQ